MTEIGHHVGVRSVELVFILRIKSDHSLNRAQIAKELQVLMINHILKQWHKLIFLIELVPQRRQVLAFGFRNAIKVS